jgi:uncharacterized protein DUF6516
MADDEHALEFLLAFDGRIHWLEQGHWLKFEIKQVEATADRPHGLRYSFTMHDPSGNRLIGFDNAHGVDSIGSRFKRRAVAVDHWHRTEADPGRPYAFTTVDQLLTDFFAEVRRVCSERDLTDAVVRVSERNDTS